MNRYTLQQKIAMLIGGFALIPFCILAFLYIPASYQKELDEMEMALLEENLHSYQDMKSDMDMIELLAKSVWADTYFITEVNKAVSQKGMNEYERYMFKEQTLATLKVIAGIGKIHSARLHMDLPEMREYTPYVYHVDKAANSLWYEKREVLFSQGEWFFGSHDKQVHETYSNYYTEKNMTSFVLPVKISGTIQGYFEIVIPTSALVQGINLEDENQEIFLIDANGRMLGQNENFLCGELVAEEMKKRQEPQGVFLTGCNEKRVMVSYIKDVRSGCYLINAVSIQKQIRSLVLRIAGLVMVEILVVIVLMVCMNRIVEVLMSDFNVFMKYMKRIGEGELDITIPELSQMEINKVAQECNHMLFQIKHMMEINLHKELLIRDAQLESLEKQIDSHFLFNSLDSIRMMAEVKKIYSVSDALSSLAKMFRYNLQMGEHEVTLREEIAYLKAYIRIENIRHEYEIYVSQNIDEYLLDMKVPKVILQPIAENAIIHGLDKQIEDTTIYIKAHSLEGRIFIEVSDMGKGITEKRLEEIRQKLENVESGGKHRGIGLKNIHERIRLMYGESSGIRIFSREGCFTKVQIELGGTWDEKNFTGRR